MHQHSNVLFIHLKWHHYIHDQRWNEVYAKYIHLSVKFQKLGHIVTWKTFAFIIYHHFIPYQRMKNRLKCLWWAIKVINLCFSITLGRKKKFTALLDIVANGVMCLLRYSCLWIKAWEQDTISSFFRKYIDRRLGMPMRLTLQTNKIDESKAKNLHYLCFVSSKSILQQPQQIMIWPFSWTCTCFIPWIPIFSQKSFRRLKSHSFGEMFSSEQNVAINNPQKFDSNASSIVLTLDHNTIRAPATAWPIKVLNVINKKGNLLTFLLHNSISSIALWKYHLSIQESLWKIAAIANMRSTFPPCLRIQTLQ